MTLQAHGLRRVYGRGDSRVEALRGVSLEVAAGAAPAAPASSGSLLAATALGAVAMLGALALRRKDGNP